VHFGIPSFLRLTITAVVFAGAAIVAATVSYADRGVGVSVGEMTVETVLAPGSSYSLPAIAVINTGDEPSDYQISIGYLADQAQQQPRPEWFVFSPRTFSLDPGASTDVVPRLIVPTDAEPGEYFALLKAQTVSRSANGTSVGVAAATKVSFSIESSSWLDAQRRQLDRWLYAWSPWTYLIPAGLLLAFLATKVRRLPFRLKIERK
jgi:hypothetical protein